MPAWSVVPPATDPTTAALEDLGLASSSYPPILFTSYAQLVACQNGGAARAVDSPVCKQVRESLGAVSNLDPQIARALSNAFRDAAHQALHAVAQVTLEKSAQLASGQEQQHPEEFRRFFGDGGDPRNRPEIATASGVIWTPNGACSAGAAARSDNDRPRGVAVAIQHRCLTSAQEADLCHVIARNTDKVAD